MLKYQATNRLNGDVFIIEEICYALAKHLIFQRVNNLAWISLEVEAQQTTHFRSYCGIHTAALRI